MARDRKDKSTIDFYHRYDADVIEVNQCDLTEDNVFGWCEVDGDGDRWFKADEYGDMQHMWEYLS